MTAAEHRKFLETDFSDVKLEELTDIGKIRIDRKKKAVYQAGGKSVHGKVRGYDDKDKICKQWCFI